MKVLVAGTGASGGLVGARLVENNTRNGACEVTFVVSTRRQRQLITGGLHLRSEYGAFRRPVIAITADQITGPYNIVVVAVRAHEFEAVLELLTPAFGPETVLVPMIEGIRHLETSALASMPRVVAAVLEARVRMDADAILSQRPPEAELNLGAIHGVDQAMATDLVRLFRGRGLKTFLNTRIRAKAAERFAFVSAAIATSHMMGRPLQDAVRMAHGQGMFERFLEEGFRVGVAAGFAPEQLGVKDYFRAFSLVGRPVQVPSRIADAGRSGDEATYLFGEMVALARTARVPAPLFESAWKRLTRPTQIEATATDSI